MTIIFCLPHKENGLAGGLRAASEEGGSDASSERRGAPDAGGGVGGRDRGGRGSLPGHTARHRVSLGQAAGLPSPKARLCLLSIFSPKVPLSPSRGDDWPRLLESTRPGPEGPGRLRRGCREGSCPRLLVKAQRPGCLGVGEHLRPPKCLVPRGQSGRSLQRPSSALHFTNGETEARSIKGFF